MNLTKVLLLAGCLLMTAVSCQKKNPIIEIQTSKGQVLVELDMENAPITAGHFLNLVKEGFYDGSCFYRTVRGSNDANPIRITVVQGGVDKNEHAPEVEPIVHESTDVTGLTHSHGTISMARNRPGSASTEFFICWGENPELDSGGRRNPDGQGFAAFGKVIEGFNPLHAIWGAPAMGEDLDPTIPIHKMKVK